MTPDQALTLLKQVGANFQGNLQDHNNIQTALRVIEEALEPSPQVELERREAEVASRQEVDNPPEA